MSELELDATVAEILGWRWVTGPVVQVAGGGERRYSYLAEPEWAAMLVAEGWEYGRHGDLRESHKIPCYSSDWSAAGDLAEWLARRESWVQAGYNPALEEWQAMVTNANAVEFHGAGKSGPEALARAFVAAFGEGT